MLGQLNMDYLEDYIHVILFRSNNNFKCRGMYHNMNMNIENFSIFIEDEDIPSNYDRILLRETELIKKI